MFVCKYEYKYVYMCVYISVCMYVCGHDGHHMDTMYVCEHEMDMKQWDII
jgi:hypothetical protein